MANGTGNGETNRPTINWVTRTLCILGFMLGGSIPVLSYFGKTISSEHNTIAGIVIGGLLSMLTKSTPTPSTPVEQTKSVKGPEQKPESEQP